MKRAGKATCYCGAVEGWKTHLDSLTDSEAEQHLLCFELGAKYLASHHAIGDKLDVDTVITRWVKDELRRKVHDDR